MQIWNGSTTPPNELAPAWEPDDLDYARNVEDYADNLMDECKTLAKAQQLFIEFELFDVFPEMMAAIANWSGSSADAPELAKRLHVLLANGMQKIAEYEVGKRS